MKWSEASVSTPKLVQSAFSARSVNRQEMDLMKNNC